uniref:Uncharacterized protein n=1 Tax=Loa loa TaxID=7209 RepID=A0A1I7W0E4_LOALO
MVCSLRVAVNIENARRNIYFAHANDPIVVELSIIHRLPLTRKYVNAKTVTNHSAQKQLEQTHERMLCNFSLVDDIRCMGKVIQNDIWVIARIMNICGVKWRFHYKPSVFKLH